MEAHLLHKALHERRFLDLLAARAGDRAHAGMLLGRPRRITLQAFGRPSFSLASFAPREASRGRPKVPIQAKPRRASQVPADRLAELPDLEEAQESDENMWEAPDMPSTSRAPHNVAPSLFHRRKPRAAAEQEATGAEDLTLRAVSIR